MRTTTTDNMQELTTDDLTEVAGGKADGTAAGNVAAGWNLVNSKGA